MEDSDELTALVQMRGYESIADMVATTGLDPAQISDNDPLTWPEHKVARTITVEVLVYGGFTVREGDRHNIGLNWDEMLGHLAAMTMPPAIAHRCYIYPMTTDAEDIEREKSRQSRRHEHKAENTSPS